MVHGKVNSFSNKQLADSHRSCALHGRIVSLKQDTTHLHYRSIRPLAYSSSTSLAKPSTVGTSDEDDDTQSLIQHYLNLGPNLTTLYEHWSSVDPNFKKRAPKFTGVRILKQDAWEALLGFICSSNNNIIRISQMVRRRYHTTFSHLPTYLSKRSIIYVYTMVH